ncbi:MAG: hypothetical protein V5A68_07225 [Candidatus Thermoplasmatota archaeon]
MALETVVDSIQTAFNNAIQSIINVLPNILAAIIILIIGYIIGKLVGGAIRKLLEKARVGARLAKSKLIKKMLSILDITFERLFGMLVSVFFYVIFILAAIDVLGIAMLSNFVNQVLLYLPNLIAGVLVLIVGLVAVEWITTFIRNTTLEYNIEGAKLITSVFRAILTLVVIIITLDQWKIDTSIIYTLIQPLAWGIAAAIALAFGWGFKDVVAKWADKKSKEWMKEK